MSQLPDSSSARVSIVKQAGKDNTVPASPSWLNMSATSITLSETLNSSDSEVLRPDRGYSNARILSGEAGGDIPLETVYGPLMDMLIMAVLQSSSSTWATAESIYNESTKQYFSLERFHTAPDGDVYKWFKDQQVNSLNLQFDANAFVSATANFMGLEVEPLGTAPKTGATYTNIDMLDQFDTNAVSIVIKDDTDTVIDTEVESGSLELSNGMAKQAGVGKFFGVGNRSSRFSCVPTFNLYFLNRKIYEGFKANKSFTVEITVTSPAGAVYLFEMKNCTVTTYDDPINGIDTDIMVSVAFRANQDNQAPSRSLTVTKTDAA